MLSKALELFVYGTFTEKFRHHGAPHSHHIDHSDTKVHHHTTKVARTDQRSEHSGTTVATAPPVEPLIRTVAPNSQQFAPQRDQSVHSDHAVHSDQSALR